MPFPGEEKLPIDALSDVLHAIRLTGAVFFDVTVRAPWVLEAPPSGVCAPHVMPGVRHVIEYHVVTAGRCWAGLIDEPPIRLEAGDILIFPQGDAHVFSSEPGQHRSEPLLDLYQQPEGTQLPVPIRAGSGDGEEARIVCGFLGFEDVLRHPLMNALPRVLHAPASARKPGDWLDAFVPQVVAECENRRPGSENILSRMSELMFVEVVRQYVAAQPPAARGWLAGLRDKSVGRALNLMHDQPAGCWTLDRLAEETGVSRSSLAERFSDYVGSPPMQYLTNWRMQLAAGWLAGGAITIAEIAEKVGYESEAAFSRAFKRNMGIAPAMWRKSQAQRLAVAAE
jgi:AraC-like DNA-binding protein